MKLALDSAACVQHPKANEAQLCPSPTLVVPDSAFHVAHLHAPSLLKVWESVQQVPPLVHLWAASKAHQGWDHKPFVDRRAVAVLLLGGVQEGSQLLSCDHAALPLDESTNLQTHRMGVNISEEVISCSAVIMGPSQQAFLEEAYYFQQR